MQTTAQRLVKYRKHGGVTTMRPSSILFALLVCLAVSRMPVSVEILPLWVYQDGEDFSDTGVGCIDDCLEPGDYRLNEF